MIRKAWPVLLVLAVAGMALVLSIALVAAQSTQQTSRSLPSDSLMQGDVFSVTIDNVGLADGFGGG